MADVRFHGIGRTVQPSETAIGVDNVANLELAWSANSGSSSPVVANGLVYIGAAGSVDAFGATGSLGCSAAPKSCIPRWRGIVGAGFASTPAVANGVVYVGSGDGKLNAFAASGTSGCSQTGTTQMCTPLWTADAGGQATPVVAHGVVYVGSPDGNLHAFDASGTTNCSGSPKTCAPLWTADTGGAIHGPPAVANGVVYVGSEFFGGYLYAFDASGTTNCSGSPRTCAPLWTGFPGDSSPAVVNGFVYIASEADGNVSAFDAAGTTGCSGTIAVALPESGASSWHSDEQFQVAVTATPAVANGVVYNASGGNVYAYDAATGVQLWSAPIGGGGSSPIVANGYLYVSGGGRLWAFKP